MQIPMAFTLVLWFDTRWDNYYRLCIEDPRVNIIFSQIECNKRIEIVLLALLFNIVLGKVIYCILIINE